MLGRWLLMLNRWLLDLMLGRTGDMADFQTVKMKHPNRTKHVWMPLAGRRWKCAICGGVTGDPSDYGDVEEYQALTAEERARCPKAADKQQFKA